MIVTASGDGTSGERADVSSKNALAVLGAALVLAGCSSGATGESSAARTMPTVSGTSAPVSSSSPGEADPSLNSRGDITIGLGAQIPLASSQTSGVVVGAWTVDKITVDYSCPGAYSGGTPAKPENGHFVKMDLRASTDAVGASNADPARGINGTDFTFIGADGVTFNGDLGTESAMEECIPNSQTIPNQLDRGQQFIGSVVIDVPSLPGTLVFYPNFLTHEPPGYEIAIG